MKKLMLLLLLLCVAGCKPESNSEVTQNNLSMYFSNAQNIRQTGDGVVFDTMIDNKKRHMYVSLSNAHPVTICLEGCK